MHQWGQPVVGARIAVEYSTRPVNGSCASEAARRPRRPSGWVEKGGFAVAAS